MNVTQPGPGGPGGFVGRNRELAVLRGALDEAVAGRGSLVLVAGPPGIGKTRLAATFGRYASGQGAMVLWGNAWEDGGAPPYWPWVQVLRSYGRQAGEPALAGAAGRDAPVLAQLLPELGVSPEPLGSGDGARFALFEAVCGLLDRASRSAPLVIVLDDLHAAGHPSALLLRFAAARRLSRVLLIATYRDIEVRLDADLSEVIGALEGHGAAAAPRSSSPTGCPRSWPPTRSSSSTTAGSPARAPTRSCSPAAAYTRTSTTGNSATSPNPARPRAPQLRPTASRWRRSLPAPWPEAPALTEVDLRKEIADAASRPRRAAAPLLGSARALLRQADGILRPAPVRR